MAKLRSIYRAGKAGGVELNGAGMSLVFDAIRRMTLAARR